MLAVDIAREPHFVVARLVAVDLGAAEGHALAASAPETKVEVRAGHEHLIRAHVGVAEDRQPGEMDAKDLRYPLLGNPCSSFLGKPRMDEIDQDLSSAAAQEERPAAPGIDAAVVVLAQRVVVAEADRRASRFVEAIVEPRRQFGGGVQVRARPGGKQPATPQPNPRQRPGTESPFQNLAARRAHRLPPRARAR